MDMKEQVYLNLSMGNLFERSPNGAIKKLMTIMGISGKSAIELLNTLKKDGRIEIYKDKLVDNGLYKEGFYHSSREGQGYIAIPNEPDRIFVKEKSNAIDGDKVKVGFVYENSRRLAFISKVLERKNNLIIGRIERANDGRIVFIPDNKSIALYMDIPQNELAIESVGKKCSLKLMLLSNSHISTNFGEIHEIYGLAGDPIVENRAIASQYGFAKTFSEEIQNELTYIPTAVEESDYKNRLDLTSKNFVTIDPSTCKDMDDAVYIEKVGNDYIVYVAIADVSNYVKKGTKLDREAYKRGTSCYLGDGVYPMLPEQLSNEICSLNPNVDRCALCVAVKIDKTGNMISYEVKKAVINSKHKLSYEDAEQIHLNKNGKDIAYADVKANIDLMYEASAILTKERRKRGALFFGNNEPTFKLDETKTKVTEVVDKSHLTSTKIIESFMILANEAIGQFFIDNNLQTLFRVHEAPQDTKIAIMVEKLGNVGLNFDCNGTGKDLQRIIDKLETSEIRDYAISVVLRSMQKAVYQRDNIGHFGLASNRYLHFTSPIRRYPDLIVHRAVSNYLDNIKDYYTDSELDFMGEYTTSQEQKAEAAEVQSIKLLSAIWAESQVGKEFEGYIYSVEKNGIVVRYGLVNMFVPSTELLDSKYGFEMNNLKTELRNTKTDNVYKVGQKVNFRIWSADRITRTIFATTNEKRLIETAEDKIQNTNQDKLDK